MNIIQTLKNKFAQIGAVVDVVEESPRGFTRPNGVSIDIQGHGKQEKFVVRVVGQDTPEINILDVKPGLRHLLLMVGTIDNPKSKILCGHDETHWFVSRVADQKVSTVVQAMENLKPREVLNMQSGVKLSKRIKNTHRNKIGKGGSIIRQGEWYFIPDPSFNPNPLTILKNEPLQRTARNKPHMCEELCRSRGMLVYVLSGRQLTERQYKILSEKEKKNPWRPMTANATMHVRGRITHPDHSTIRLNGWHRVQINNEASTGAIRWLD